MTAPAARYSGWSHVNHLTCPHGHHVRRDAFVMTDMVVRCKHRLPGGGECGTLLYLVASVPARTPETVPSLVFVVEVTYPETQAILALGLGTLDVLARLGATLPGRAAYLTGS